MVYKAGAIRLLVLVTAMAMVAVACGAGDDADPESDVGLSSDAGPTETGPTDPELTGTEDEGGSGGELSVQVQAVNFPAGIVVSDGENQNANLGGASYLVTARSDGMRLVAITSDGAFDTEALIPGGLSAEVFNSGSRIVMTGTDAEGNLAVLSSDDGETFTEAQIPIPQRYVDADVWQATSLIGDALGVADLGGDLYLIARVGIDWPFDAGVVARYAYTISEEIGDAATSAGTVVQAPQGDGDVLYTFKADGEVVFEVLGSEAGLEPGYRDAFQQALGEDTGFTGGWIISGSTATQTTMPPLGGGLDEDMRLNSLYSVGDGVAALVKDFSPGAMAPQDDPTDGQTVLISARRPDTVLAQSSTVVALGVYHTWDGEVWKPAGEPIGDKDGLDAEVVADSDSDAYVMVFVQGSDLTVRFSDDGLDWEGATSTVTMSLLDGGQVESVDGRLILILPEGSDGDPNVFEMIPGEAVGEEVVDMYLDPITLDADQPTIEWIDDEPDPYDDDRYNDLDSTHLMVLNRNAAGDGDAESINTAFIIGSLIDEIDSAAGN